VPSARHRAGGFGRPIPFRTAAPRHAAPFPAPARALPGWSGRRSDPAPRRGPGRTPLLVGAVLAVMLGPVAGALVAVAVDAHRDGAVVPPLPNPAPNASRPPGPAFVPPVAVPRAIKARSPVPLGVLTSDRLTAYCRARYGPAISAAPTDDGWTCWPPDTDRGLIDADAACRWGFGDDGWAGAPATDDSTTWRCYRDPS
jgi:hypothetical protein